MTSKLFLEIDQFHKQLAFIMFQKLCENLIEV